MVEYLFTNYVGMASNPVAATLCILNILSQISIQIETSQLLVQSNCNKINFIWPGYWFKKGLILKFSNLIDSFWIKTFRVKLIKIVYPKTFRLLHIITTVTEINYAANLNNYVTMQTFMVITLRNGRKTQWILFTLTWRKPLSYRSQCFTNQWTGVHKVVTSVMKVLIYTDWPVVMPRLTYAHQAWVYLLINIQNNSREW